MRRSSVAGPTQLRSSLLRLLASRRKCSVRKPLAALVSVPAGAAGSHLLRRRSASGPHLPRVTLSRLRSGSRSSLHLRLLASCWNRIHPVQGRTRATGPYRSALPAQPGKASRAATKRAASQSFLPPPKTRLRKPRLMPCRAEPVGRSGRAPWRECVPELGVFCSSRRRGAADARRNENRTAADSR